MTQPLGPLQQAWINALRSGEYPQSKGQLQTPLGYCCLGVACRVLEKHSVEVHLDEEKNILGMVLVETQPSVRNALKIQNEGELIRLNDDAGKTFPEIATWIENNPEVYFTEPA